MEQCISADAACGLLVEDDDNTSTFSDVSSPRNCVAVPCSIGQASNVFVDHSSLSTAELTGRLKKVAQGVDAFGWPSDLIFDEKSVIPASVQRLESVVERARALHGSVDKRDQIGADGPAAYSKGNLDLTTTILNFQRVVCSAKHGPR